MNTLQTQLNTTRQVNQQPLVLTEDQVIHGKIQQLFPGQLAEVQVGQQKMIAKLEVPMRAGDSYYFQVTSAQPEIQLKILSGPTGSQVTGREQIQNLMQAMQLPKSPEMTKLLSFMINNKTPMSRENIRQAVQLLQATPENIQQHALPTIQRMLDLDLPLTKQFFQAILNVESKEGLHATMQNLRKTLQNDSSVSPKIRNQILQLLSQIERPLESSTSNALLGEALKTLVDDKQDSTTRFSTLQLLKEAGILPRHTSLPNLQSMLVTGVETRLGISPDGDGVQKSIPLSRSNDIIKFLNEVPGLTAGQKENLLIAARSHGIQQFSQALIQVLSENIVSNPMQSPSGQNATGNTTTQSVQLLLSLLHEQQTSDSVKMTTLLQKAEASEKPTIHRLVQLAESTISAAIDGKTMKETMQTVFRSLGMNYESQLLGKETQPERFMQSLKPQLIAMLNDPGVSASVREVAEQFVVRMNGSPLMSAEMGVNHQLVMQLPLELFGKKIDATLQWNSRMKENDKIDADFARILFYLDLNSLEETVIDMQVQNRIVTVTVFNENPSLKILSQPLQKKLRDGLREIDYTLSGVFFKGFEKNQKEYKSTKRTEVIEGGLDFRI